MKSEIILSAVPIFNETDFRRALDIFEAECNIHVNLQMVEWEHYRQEFVNTALHRIPADVGICGMPATSDLIAMNALRPFAPAEINRIGGAEAFLPSRWRSGIRPNTSEVWAVPVVADPRVIYYRKDLLARASVDPAVAFKSFASMQQAFQQLQQAGILPTISNNLHYEALHHAVSFIWTAGGDIFSADGRRAIFHEPEALDGLRAFFNMYRTIPIQDGGINIQRALLDGRAAMIVENAYGLYSPLPDSVGCTSVLGTSYIGGSDIMIWNHTRQDAAAFELVHFLTRADVLAPLAQEASFLSTRMSDLNAQAAQSGPIVSPLIEAVYSGRCFPCVPMVGLIEDRLTRALLSIHQDLLADPSADLEALLQQRIVSLGKRTNMSLESMPRN